MSNIIMELSEYLSDKEISEGLHMEADEILRLRHATGYAALYAKHKYNKTWEMKRQVRHRRAYQEEHGPESIPV